MTSTLSPGTVGEGRDGPGGAPAPAAGSSDRGPLPDGTVLSHGRYRLAGVLGRGGFGITYRAEDLQLRRPVAIKELFPDGARRDGASLVVPGAAADGFARSRERFLREATTLARFGHPNIVRIFAVFEEHGTAYLVLERLDGRTLAAELRTRRGPFTEPEALDVAGQAAAALAIVHRAGVLHRDVSPANLVRTTNGRIVLIDFGLARPYADDHTTSMTRIVTPGYAPPEQYAGQARFSPRADVYALGATLYRLLSGRTPPAPNERARGGRIEPLWRVNPTVSRSVSDAVDDALDLDPAGRPSSVRALLERLDLDPDALDLDLGPDPLPEEPDAAPGTDDRATRAATAGLAPLVPAPRAEPATGPAWRPGNDPAPADSAADVDPARPTVVIGPAPPAERTVIVAGDRRRPSPIAPVAPVAPDPADRRTEVVPVTRPPAERPRPPAATPAAVGPLAHVAAPAGPPALLTPPPAPGGVDPARRLPLAVGAPPPGRAWVTLPLGLAGVALASAQPATVVLLIGLGVAPLLATAGDRVLRPHRNPAWMLSWWARNLAVGVVRSLGALVILVVGLCLWAGTDSFGSLEPAGPWVLRATGVAAGWVLALSVGRGGPGFRSHVALDALTIRLLPRARVTLPAAVFLIVCLAVTAAGLWFQPEAWPLGG